MPITPLKPNIILHGRYRILKKIGSGGFGITYAAEDLSLRIEVVIKEFALDLICSRDSTNATIAAFDGHEVEMTKWTDKFVLEARNLAKIRHLGVVAVQDVWKEKGTVYYAMENIEGGELPSSVDLEWKAKSWFEAKKIAVALLEALREVHKADLLHGDIKPANILIRKDSGLPVLIDFGTARSLEKAQNQTATTMACTLGYAPIELQERSLSKKTGPSSDLYSWAMVVIGMVSKYPHGNLPTDAKIRTIMFHETKQDRYSEESLREWLPNFVPNSAVAILASCLMLESKHRPQSANAVLKLLENSKQPNTVLEQSENELRIINNSKRILFALIVGILVGIIGLKLFLTENRSVNNYCGAGTQWIDGECLPNEINLGSVSSNEDPKITDLVLCAENEHVLSHVCEPCAFGSTNEAGDDASGDNTACEVRIISEGFVWIPAGSFMMGSPENEAERENDETQHEVTITRSFYMQIHEVTQGEWRELMGNNPSYFSSCGSDCPVEMVSWYDALAYANALSEEHNLDPCFTIDGTNVTISATTIYDCSGYRLPTAAEWEYSARAGTRTAFYNGERTLDDIAWYGGNSNRRTHPVAQLEANSWGVYDMSGNVWEWCWDRYGSYESSSITDPIGANSGSNRVLRGGSWFNSASGIRSAARNSNDPTNRNRYRGFRLFRSAL